MRLILIPIGACAMIAVLAVYFATRPAPKPVTMTKNVNVVVPAKRLSNEEFLSQLGNGQRVTAAQCMALFGIPGWTGRVVGDIRHKRITIVCAAPVQAQ